MSHYQVFYTASRLSRERVRSVAHWFDSNHPYYRIFVYDEFGLTQNIHSRD